MSYKSIEMSSIQVNVEHIDRFVNSFNNHTRIEAERFVITTDNGDRIVLTPSPNTENVEVEIQP